MLKTSKKLLTASMAVALALGGISAVLPAAPAAAAATVNPSVYIDGVKLNFTGQQPVIEKGRTLVPMRAIFEALGATIQYEPKTGNITATKKDSSYAVFTGDTTVSLTLGSAQARVQSAPSEEWAENAVDKTVTLDVPAQVVKGSTMVPLAFIGQALDCRVSWDQANNRISIFKPQVKEYWYQQNPWTGEVLIRYDLMSYAHPDPVPTEAEQVYLRTVAYGNQKAVAFYAYHLTRIAGEDTNEEPLIGDVMFEGTVENGIWQGIYQLGLDDTETEEWDFLIEDEIRLQGYVNADGSAVLNQIPFSVYTAIEDADGKGWFE